MRATLATRLTERVATKRRDVFLRADFEDLGGHDQVGRALGQLVRDGKLVRIGSGVYARARASALDGTPTPVKGLRALADEALRRLGFETAPTQLECACSEGKTTQAPAGHRIVVNKRVRRKICYNGAVMSFERARPSSH